MKYDAKLGSIRLGRRTLLEGFLGAATAVYVGPIAPPAPSERVANPHPVDDGDFAVLESVVEAVVSGDPAFPPARELSLRPYFENLLGQMAAFDRDQFLRLLTLLQYSTALTHRSRFTNLSVEARVEALTSWAHSSLTLRRQAFTALKMTACMVYFAADKTWAAVGYDGPWVDQTEIAVLDPPPLSFYSDVPPGGKP
ncbi:MAG: hypothetical protein IT350_14310 [Deltaproteobacteria bacterium]|nr:hypothetical protein [Deltaproteobacteria bacterium]